MEGGTGFRLIYTDALASQTTNDLEDSMPRRRRVVQGVESSQDLARKLEVLERELAVQRAAMEKLKELGPSRRVTPASSRKTA